MRREKSSYKYHIREGKKTVGRGVTYDLPRREAEEQRNFPGCRLVQIGQRTTREAALRWLEARGP